MSLFGRPTRSAGIGTSRVAHQILRTETAERRTRG